MVLGTQLRNGVLRHTLPGCCTARPGRGALLPGINWGLFEQRVSGATGLEVDHTAAAWPLGMRGIPGGMWSTGRMAKMSMAGVSGNAHARMRFCSPDTAVYCVGI